MMGEVIQQMLQGVSFPLDGTMAIVEVQIGINGETPYLCPRWGVGLRDAFWQALCSIGLDLFQTVQGA